jgi:spermidine/putrescine transport system ATP-binding protein
MAANAVILEDISKAFGPTLAVDHVSLSVAEGEFVALLGPSGCGKTTTLRMIAGFEHPTGGRVLIDGREVTGVPAYRRNASMVFQSYALFPHLTVFENIAFGLRERGVPTAAIAGRVARYLEMVRLPGFEGRLPGALSGGEQQRVALARALIVEPAVLLLDEPLGALDRKLREEMQLEVKELLRRLHITSIFVTHDQDEALAMADRVAVMNQGRIEQVDTPEMIYENPRTPFCAGFLGLSNIFHGKLAPGEDGPGPVSLTTSAGLRLTCPAGPPQPPSGEAALMIRPEKVILAEGAAAGVNCFRGEIAGLKYLGATIEYHVALREGERIVLRQQQSLASGPAPRPGQSVTVQIPATALRWLEVL